MTQPAPSLTLLINESVELQKNGKFSTHLALFVRAVTSRPNIFPRGATRRRVKHICPSAGKMNSRLGISAQK